MDRILRVSEENRKRDCSASCEDLDDAFAEKTSKPGEDGQFDQKQPTIIA